MRNHPGAVAEGGSPKPKALHFPCLGKGLLTEALVGL